MKHTILLDSKKFQSKPTNGETAGINERLVNNPITISIDDLALATTNGQTFCPSYVKESRTKKNYIGLSIFVLDFDNKDKKTKTKLDNPISFEQARQRLNEYSLDCTFAYTTFSHDEDWHRFRVVLQLNQCIIDTVYHRQISDALIELFPEADIVTRNPISLFYGGKELIFANYDYILDLAILFEAAQFYAIKNSSSQNLSRDLKCFRKKVGLDDKRSKFNTPYINNIESVSYASKSHEEETIEIVRDIDFEKLRGEIRVLDDFMNASIKLLHPQLLGLATNLRYIEGGQILYKKTITANPDYAQAEKLKIMAYCKNCNYPPISLRDFSPYSEDWEYGNLLQAAKKKDIIRLEAPKTMSIEQAREQLKTKFELISSLNDKNIHVLKALPGIGKTELYVDLKNVVIATPYHSLKSEISTERMKVEHKLTPSTDKLPDEVKIKLKYYYSIGAVSWANQYLSEMSPIHESVKQYRDECLTCYSSENTVLTTHPKGIFIKWAHETLIFDEDVMRSLMPIDKVTMNDLVRLEASISNERDKRILSSLIDDIREGKVNTPREMDLSIFDDFSVIEDEVLSSYVKYDSNILYFFDSKYFVVDSQDASTIHYIRKYQLPKDKKIIIMSATADENLYEYLFEDRLRFYDLSSVETIGLIEQDTKYSLSRTSMSKHLNDVVGKVRDLPVITFAKFKEQFYNPVQGMHFGHCSGSDEYSGKDIAVVGTPHVSPITIALYAKALGVPVKTHEFSRVRQQNVYHNGFRFWFNTYDNEYLRSIQFYFIESELRQAIGRARPYTTPSKVQVYSNYPLPESCIGKEELELGRERLEKVRKTHLEQCLSISPLKKGVVCSQVN